MIILSNNRYERENIKRKEEFEEEQEQENSDEDQTVSEKDLILPLKKISAMNHFFSRSNENWVNVEKPKMYKR